jgi:hypothetical protein
VDTFLGPEVPCGRSALLGDELAQQARETAYEIAMALARRDPTGLGETTDAALYWAHVAQMFPEPWVEHAFERSMASLADAIDGGVVSIGMFGGLAGAAWAAHVIDDAPDEPGSEDPDTLPPRVDAILVEALSRKEWSGHYDLISGLVGFGVYFLARRRHALARRGLRLTLDRLESMAQPARGGSAWVTPAALLPAHHRRTHPEGMIDLGIAHGVPGVVAFYSAVLLARVLPGHEEASLRRSLLSAVGFLEAHRQPQREHAAFDWCVAPGVAGRAARTAWCYGDPGVALALLRASWALQDHALYDRALSLARACATRPDDKCAVQDAGLCHGAAGLGHLFRRLGDATGDEVLREGARRWFRNTLALRRPDELAGFPAFETADAPAGQGTYRASPGILAGAAGVGLALMSALGASADWDQRLLLDLTPAG